MKKSFALVLAAASILTVSANAAALDVGDTDRDILINGQPAGTVNISSLGAYAFGPFDTCKYRLTQTSEFNPNIVARCEVLEARTDEYPDCVENRTIDFTTFVTNNGLKCYLVDPLGVKLEVLSFGLLLGETDQEPSLSGIAYLDELSPNFVSVIIE